MGWGETEEWLSPRTLRWPDREAGPFEVVLHFAAVDGRAECVGVEVWGKTPPQRVSPGTDDPAQAAALPPGVLRSPLPGVVPVTATDLRRVPLASLIEEVAEVTRQQLAILRRRPAVTWPDGSRFRTSAGSARRATAASSKWAAGPRRGRPAIFNDQHWRHVAALYSEAASVPGRPKPTKAVAEAMSVSHSTAAKWVARVRGMGLLPRTQRGVASGPGAGAKGRRSE